MKKKKLTILTPFGRRFAYIRGSPNFFSGGRIGAKLSAAGRVRIASKSTQETQISIDLLRVQMDNK